MLDKEAWKEQCRVNARSLESEITHFQSDYSKPLGLGRHKFWAHARQISAMCKMPLFREDRERLWAAYSAACEEMKHARTRVLEARRADSREKRKLVMSKIREAHFQAEAAATSAEFAEADALLGEALAWMKNGWEGFNAMTQLISPIVGGSGILTPEDRDDCWDAWKEAKELLRLRRDEFYAKVRTARAVRWRDWIEQNDEFIEKLQTEIDECEELERNARTEDFADRIRSRIDAKLQKISDLERRNEEFETKIADAESRLSF